MLLEKPSASHRYTPARACTSRIDGGTLQPGGQHAGGRSLDIDDRSDVLAGLAVAPDDVHHDTSHAIAIHSSSDKLARSPEVDVAALEPSVAAETLAPRSTLERE